MFNKSMDILKTDCKVYINGGQFKAYPDIDISYNVSSPKYQSKQYSYQNYRTS